jgi:hypothetical protein
MRSTPRGRWRRITSALCAVAAILGGMGCRESRRHLTTGKELALRCSMRPEEIRRLLGEPTHETKGQYGLEKKLLEETAHMGISSMFYKDLGVRIDLRHAKAYYVGVTKRFDGRFHGFPLGARFEEVVAKLGLPYGNESTPERAIKVDLGKDYWLGSGASRVAFYLVHGEPTHFYAFAVDRKGVVDGIFEEDDKIRGGWFIMPRH